MIKYIISLSLLTLTLSGCIAQENLKDYYYPIRTQEEVKIYKYVDKNNVTNIEYWKVTTIPKSNKIITITYNSELNPYNYFVEKVKSDGAELLTYTDFETNDNGVTIEIKAEVLEKDIYKWDDSKDYAYSVKYNNKYGSFEFKKKRAFSKFEHIEVNGKKYRAAKFRDDYLIHHIDDNVEYIFYQDAYYVKDIGMIKYKRIIPSQNEPIELELVEILDEGEFEKLNSKKYQQVD